MHLNLIFVIFGWINHVKFKLLIGLDDLLWKISPASQSLAAR